MKLILIKYGELTTKKSNRKFFINTLNNNIINILKGTNVNIRKDRVRMYIEINDNDLDLVLTKLQYVFGIHGIVVCEKVNSTLEDIQSKILEIIKDTNYKTFKIITKRADKNFEIHSTDMNHLLGGFVLKNSNLKVDVINPELPINVEIREDATYIYTNEIKGLGGYPVNIQGKGMLMLSGGIDSPVAGFLALKRGVSIDCLYFEAIPHTSIEARNKILKLASILNNYSGNIKVHVVPFTEIEETIYKNCPNDYVITIMRRMMYRISERYAKKVNAKIIINGESIGQVASQTLSSMSVINETIKMPVIRPVACMDKLEIIEIAKKIDTYNTSILPFEDCCTIFVPKHPVINPSLDKCIEFESRFDYEPLIEKCINDIKVFDNFDTNEFDDLL